MRLEFGLLNETLCRLYTYIKVWYWIKQNLEENSLNESLWLELEKEKNLPAYKFLEYALKATCIIDLWNKNMPYPTFKLTLNKAPKFHSLLVDKGIFAKRSHFWTVINSYKRLKQAAYLDSTFSIHVKRQLMALWFGKFPTLADAPQ